MSSVAELASRFRVAGYTVTDSKLDEFALRIARQDGRCIHVRADDSMTQENADERFETGTRVLRVLRRRP